jgi:hypothetical protein
MNPKRDPVTDLLQRARRRISDPNHWIQKTYATDAAGYGRPAASPDASRWCAVGALQAEGFHAPGAVVQQAFRRLHDRAEVPVGVCSDGTLAALQKVEWINDHQGHGAVLALYDAAIRGK